MQDATLIVSFDQAGNQLELWEVKLAPATDTDPGSVVYVDADTGSVVDPLK